MGTVIFFLHKVNWATSSSKREKTGSSEKHDREPLVVRIAGKKNISLG